MHSHPSFRLCPNHHNPIALSKAVDLVYSNFQKAFGKVPHERLMVKVNARDIQGDAAR